jgi:hypothetical protein
MRDTSRKAHGSPRTPPARRWLLPGAALACAGLLAGVIVMTAGGRDASAAVADGALPDVAAAPARERSGPPTMAVPAAPRTPVQRGGRLAAAGALAAPPGPAPEHPQDGPEDATDRAPRPGTERAFREAFEALSAQSPGALSAAAVDVFARPGPDCERVALLTVLWERDEEQAPQWFVQALRAGTRHGGPATGHETVASFAVSWLAERVETSTAAGDVLGAYVRDPSPPADAGLRRRAASAVAAHGSRQQLVQLAADLAPSRDLPLIRLTVLAVQDNPHAESVRPLFAPLAERLPPGVLADVLADGSHAPLEADG